MRDNVLSTNEGKYRQFALIVDDEYKDVIAKNIPVASPVKITDRTDKSITPSKEMVKKATLVGFAAIAGALAARKFSQRASRVK